MTEKQINKILERIKKHKRHLSNEKKRFGWYDDSYGRRYVIAELYLKIEDFKSANRYFNWFQKTFPDDGGFPSFHLMWSRTLFERNKKKDSKVKLIQVELQNSYLIDLLIGKPTEAIEKSELISYSTLSYAIEIKPNCASLISDEFKNWIKEIVENNEYKERKLEWISIEKRLLGEKNTAKRSELLDLAREIKQRWMNMQNSS